MSPRYAHNSKTSIGLSHHISTWILFKECFHAGKLHLRQKVTLPFYMNHYFARLKTLEFFLPLPYPLSPQFFLLLSCHSDSQTLSKIIILTHITYPPSLFYFSPWHSIPSNILYILLTYHICLSLLPTDK